MGVAGSSEIRCFSVAVKTIFFGHTPWVQNVVSHINSLGLLADISTQEDFSHPTIVDISAQRRKNRSNYQKSLLKLTW